MRTVISILLLLSVCIPNTGWAGPYDGRYRDEPAVKALLADLEAMKARALAHVTEWIGLKSDGHSIVILVADMPQKDGPHAWTDLKDQQGLAKYRIILALPPVIAGVIDAEEEVRHEMVHAVMQEKLGQFPGKGFSDGDYIFLRRAEGFPALPVYCR